MKNVFILAYTTFFKNITFLIKTNLDLDKTAQHHMPFQRYAMISFKIEMLVKFLEVFFLI